MRLFQTLQEMAEDEDLFLCLLIDEVESLTAARSSSSSSDPGDAVRVVNAMLTQLDQLIAYPNVIVFATSNLSDHLDLAFVDRADLKVFMGLPCLEARVSILCSCVEELCRVHILRKQEEEEGEEEEEEEEEEDVFGSLKGEEAESFFTSIENREEKEEEEGDDDEDNFSKLHRILEPILEDTSSPFSSLSSPSSLLLLAAIESEGMSGRALRKLPIQTYCTYLAMHPCMTSVHNNNNSSSSRYGGEMNMQAEQEQEEQEQEEQEASLMAFLACLITTIRQEKEHRSLLGQYV